MLAVVILWRQTVVQQSLTKFIFFQSIKLPIKNVERILLKYRCNWYPWNDLKLLPEFCSIQKHNKSFGWNWHWPPALGLIVTAHPWRSHYHCPLLLSNTGQSKTDVRVKALSHRRKHMTGTLVWGGNSRNFEKVKWFISARCAICLCHRFCDAPKHFA